MKIEIGEKEFALLMRARDLRAADKKAMNRSHESEGAQRKAEEAVLKAAREIQED